MARWTVLALILWAIIDVLRAIIAVGRYEHRITVITHGNPDVLPAWLAYQLLRNLMPGSSVVSVADWSWIAGSLVAATAVIAWLHRARRNAARLGHAPLIPAAQPTPMPPWLVIVAATLVVHMLGWLYRTVTSPGGVLEQTTLDTRWVAYPLWTVMAIMTVLTATRTARVIRQTTHAQRLTAEPQ